jgi:hypothetical protein
MRLRAQSKSGQQNRDMLYFWSSTPIVRWIVILALAIFVGWLWLLSRSVTFQIII